MTDEILDCLFGAFIVGSVDGDYMRAAGASRLPFDHHVTD